MYIILCVSESLSKFILSSILKCDRTWVTVICVSDPHEVHFYCLTILFVSYASVKLEAIFDYTGLTKMNSNGDIKSVMTVL